MSEFKIGDRVVLVKDVYELVGNTDSYGYTFKLGDSFEVVSMLTMPSGKWICQGMVCLEDLEGLEEFFVVKAKEETKKSALEVQISGNHYKDCGIQPVEYIHANGLNYFEGNVIKYTTRHAKKNGKADIEKAIHYLQMILELQYNENDRYNK